MRMIRVFPGLILALCLLTAGAAWAQAAPGADAVIERTASQYPLSVALPDRPGWTAMAYDAGTVYGLWRVQFWDASGEMLATADVWPDTGEILYFEGVIPATPAQQNDGRDAIYDFLAGQPRLISLLDDLDDYEVYIEYDPWQKTWNAWIDDGYNSLYAVVRAGDGLPWSLEDPELVAVAVPNILPVDEWLQATQSEAIALAYQSPDIADALRDVDGWTGRASPIGGDQPALWAVEFLDGDAVVARATVDVERRDVVSFEAAAGA